MPARLRPGRFSPAFARNLARSRLSWHPPIWPLIWPLRPRERPMRDDESDLTDPDAGAKPSNAEPEPSPEPGPAAWVGAAGVSGEHVIAGERAPRLHWALMILGPIGLAVAILSSLWSSSQQVERSVNVQVEETWAAGEQLAIRTQLVDGGFEPIEDATVSLAVVAGGERRELAQLDRVAPGFSQGRFEVPELPAGEAELLVHFEPGPNSKLEPFDETIPVTIVADREQVKVGRQVVSEHMLQWADDTDPQPEGVRIDLRPAGRLLAGFDNTLFVRVTDPAGKPWKPAAPTPAAPTPETKPTEPEPTEPAEIPARVQVLLVSGEFDGKLGKSEGSPIVFEGPLDSLGLASFSGVLASDVVRFEVRLLGDPTNPKRRLRFVSHAGTVRVRASTDLAHPGHPVAIAVEAISARKPVYVDAHGPTGAWLDSFTPPLQVPQEREWTIPASFIDVAKARTTTLIQFEAYQSTLRPEDSSALARVQVVGVDTTPREWIAALVAAQRAQLSLPRVDKEFEVGREKAYLTLVETHFEDDQAAADEAAVARTRAFLIGSLEAIVHGPPQALNTRAREDETLAAFKRRWTVGVRWFLLGGGGLFIVVMSAMVWRNQRRLEIQTSAALGLAAGRKRDPLAGEPVELESEDEELLADQSLSLLRSRREILARGVFTIALMVAALALTVAMLEALVWEY